MKKRGVRLSKTLLKAQFLSLLFLILAGITFLVIVMSIPGTAWAQVFNFIRINHDNPEVFFSDYYQKLEAITNQEDWLIISPISFFISGLTYGAVLAKRYAADYIVKSGAITGLIWSAILLTLSTLGPAAEASSALSYGFHLPMPVLTWRIGLMVIVQSVYWTLFFAAGSLAALPIRRRFSTSSGKPTASGVRV